MLDQYLSEHRGAHTERCDDKSGRFAKREGKYDPVTKRYLVQVAWGKGDSYINDLQKAVKKARDRMGIPEDDNAVDPCPMMLMRNMSEAKRREQRSVIDDYDLASRSYTADYLYAVAECRRMASADGGPIVREEHKARLTEARERYQSLSAEIKALREVRRREHLSLQPSMRRRIVDAMHADPNFTWKGLEVAIDHWCSDSTIKRWVSSMMGFASRSKRTLPAEFL